MSLDMFEKYIFERESKHIYKIENGFAKYSYDLSAVPPFIYLEDVYVEPEFRRSKKAIQIADAIVKIGKDLGCTRLLGSVVPSTKGAHESMLLMLYYEMKLFSSVPGLIFFKKDI